MFVLSHVCTGIIIAVEAEPSFVLVGFVAAVVSTAARALKTILQAVLLSDPEEQLDSFNLLKFMAP
jgi:hypothetical protein